MAKEEKNEVEVESTEISDEFVDKKDKKKKVKKQSLISKIIGLIIWLVVFAWAGILLYDYYNVNQEKEPKFCLKTEIFEYEDGSVTLCTGLGYKVYRYEREILNAREFGPFWIENRSEKLEEE